MTVDEYNAMRLVELRTGISISEQIKSGRGQKSGQISDVSEEVVEERRRLRHDEDILQKKCVDYFNRYYVQYRLMLNHCPCETKRDAKVGAKLKEMGMRAGYPDLVLHLPRHGYGSLGIELKTLSGRQSEHQKEMQKVWEESGNKYYVIRSYEQFVALIEWWVYGGDKALELPPAIDAIRPKLKFKKPRKKRS